jgi:hypothetical protein
MVQLDFRSVSQSARDFPPRSNGALSGNDGFGYFAGLSESNLDSTEFKKKWMALAPLTLQPWQLSVLLNRTSKAVRAIEDINETKHAAIKDFLFKHIKIWETKVLRTINEFKPTDLANSMCGLAGLGLKPPKDFVDAWEKKAATDIKFFDAKDLSTSLWAFATLGILPSKKFLQAWEEKCSREIETFNDVDLALSLWSLSVMAVLEGKQKPSMLVTDLHNRLGDMEVYSSHRQQYCDASLYFDLPMVHERDTKKEKASFSEEQLAACFAKIATPAGTHKIEALDHNVDIALRYRGHSVLVEADGFYHFIQDRGAERFAFNGNTLLQSALIQKCAPEAIIIRMRHSERPKLTVNCANTPKELTALLDHAVACGPGVYETCTMIDGSLSLRDHLPTAPYSPAQP